MKLSVVATPIGNMEDITLRALRVLKEVDLILCEDTRHTKQLLARYEIHTPTLSYHAQSGTAKYEKIFAFLEEGKHLALVSDAGTPAISDPGARLVGEARERFGDALTLEAIPGASALTAALSIVGFPASEFLFLGFLPHKKGRETLFAEVASSTRTVVLYESPHRLLKTLDALVRVLAPTREMAVCRELTKLHESVVCGTPATVREHFAEHADQIRGEMVLIVNGA